VSLLAEKKLRNELAILENAKTVDKSKAANVGGAVKAKPKDRKKTKEVSAVLAGGDWDALLRFNSLNFDSSLLKNSFYELTHAEEHPVKHVCLTIEWVMFILRIMWPRRLSCSCMICLTNYCYAFSPISTSWNISGHEPFL
jgi:hypothetical protein